MSNVYAYVYIDVRKEKKSLERPIEIPFMLL